MNKPRKIKWAIVLSILLLGLGQIYNGQWKKGILFLTILYTVPYFLVSLGLPSSLIGLIIFIVTLIILFLSPIIDSAVVAKKSKDYKLMWFNKPLYYIGLIVVVYSINYFLQDFSFISRYQRFHVVVPNMYPSLRLNDSFIADMNYYDNNTPKHGDLTVYKAPYDTNTFVVGRIAGLSGDTIKFTDFNLFVNGIPEQMQYLEDGIVYEKYETRIFESSLGNHKYKIALFKDEQDYGPPGNYSQNEPIKDDNYFILGDSRSDSYDSRNFGTVGIQSIAGRPLYYIFSDYKEKIGEVVE